jgi:hypothetical protein
MESRCICLEEDFRETHFIHGLSMEHLTFGFPFLGLGVGASRKVGIRGIWGSPRGVIGARLSLAFVLSLP